MGRAVFPPCCLTWDQTMVEVIKKMATTFKRSMHTLPHSVPLTLQQATANPCLWQRLLDTHGQVWVSFLWDHYSFLLDPGAYKVLFVPSKTLFPQSCVSSGSSGKSSRKTFTSVLTMPKPLTVWITTNSGKFFKRWEYQTTKPASWEISMQVKKQQLELDMEQQTGSKLGKE